MKERGKKKKKRNSKKEILHNNLAPTNAEPLIPNT